MRRIDNWLLWYAVIIVLLSACVETDNQLDPRIARFNDSGEAGSARQNLDQNLTVFEGSFNVINDCLIFTQSGPPQLSNSFVPIFNIRKELRVTSDYIYSGRDIIFPLRTESSINYQRTIFFQKYLILGN